MEFIATDNYLKEFINFFS